MGNDTDAELRESFKEAVRNLGEIRRITVPAEVSIEERSAGKPMLIGHAAVFNSLSEDLGGFREVIRPGAFRKTIQEADVAALVNHVDYMPLARTSNGSLRLAEDARGLRTEIDINSKVSYARDLLENVRTGTIHQQSFGFRVVKDNWRAENGAQLRELHEVRLLDVSPVTFPAYAATDVIARSLLKAAGLDPDELSLAFAKKDQAYLRRAITILSAVVAEPVESDHSAQETNVAQPRSLSVLRKRIALAERSL